MQVAVNVMLAPATGNAVLVASTHETPAGGCQLMFTEAGELLLLLLRADTE